MQDEEKNKNAEKFQVLKTSTEQYITCENAAKQLQDGSDYLSEQVSLYDMTEEVKYMDLYFTEANKTRRRENALKDADKALYHIKENGRNGCGFY